MFVRHENLGLLLAFVGVVLFGGTLPATRLAVEFLDPWFVTFARAAIAGIAALALLLAFRSRVPPRAPGVRSRSWGWAPRSAFRC